MSFCNEVKLIKPLNHPLMDLKKVTALYERAENATDRKEAQKVLKKIRKIEKEEQKKLEPWWRKL